jgi:hypothetical protein
VLAAQGGPYPQSTPAGSGSPGGELLTSLLDQAGGAEAGNLISRGEHLLAMRRVRELTGLRLLDASRVAGSLRH